MNERSKADEANKSMEETGIRMEEERGKIWVMDEGGLVVGSGESG